MNFSYDGADLSKIIRRYTRNQNEYSVEYLDGSSRCYVSYVEDEEDIIKKEMLEQAKQRDKLFDRRFLSFVDNGYLLSGFISALGLSVAQIKDEQSFKTFWIATLLFSIYKFRFSGKKIEELEKYKLFLKLIDVLGEKELNSSKYTKCYEADNIYAQKLDINNLDKFSFRDIKRIQRVYESSIK